NTSCRSRSADISSSNLNRSSRLRKGCFSRDSLSVQAVRTGKPFLEPVYLLLSVGRLAPNPRYGSHKANGSGSFSEERAKVALLMKRVDPLRIGILAERKKQLSSLIVDSFESDWIPNQRIINGLF